ncbi:MAG: DUF2723 domain-containing protein [Chloroflexota bacterium]|nr:DUF2723 domain-containing protein [Chloroflexota bacterium]
MSRTITCSTETISRYGDLLIELALGVAALALYLRTMAPTVLDGDGGEFQSMVYILGVPHSSGYPLYILLGKLFTLLPIGDVAYRVNLLSVICAALAIPLVYAVAMRVMHSRVPALLATLVLAATPSVWGGALETKPYALHFLLGVLALLFALRWQQDHQARDFYALALVFGLGATNHHVILFTAPAFALVVWFNRARLNRALLARGALLALVPLLLYAYIPIRANYFIAQQDPANWKLYTREDAILKGAVTEYYINTPQGFVNLITGLDNSYKLGFKSDAEQASRVDNAVSLLLQQFNLVGSALAALGAVESFRRDRRIFSILFAYAAGIALIALVLRGISTVYYFSLAYFIAAVWIGFAIDALMRWFARVQRALPYAIALAALALPISSLATNYARLDESANYAPRDDAQAVLRDHLPPNAVLIAPWEVSQPLRYFQFVENQRPDLLVVHVSPASKQFEAMMTNAHALNRPFYSVEFNPEVKAPGVPRSVQAIPLPLMTEPQPRYRLNDARIVPQVQVLGYDLEPEPPIPGEPARILVYYRAFDRMFPMYSAALRVTDLQGSPVAESSGFPGSFYLPTYRWYQFGEFYRDAWSIDLSPDAPAGLYNVTLSWYVYHLETRKPDFDQENLLALGTIRVGDFSGGAITHAQNARVGDAFAFLGWNASGDSIARGQSLNLDLFWRADRAAPDSYTVFVHLTDASGRVVADADSVPFGGLYPTNLWDHGEKLRDRHILKIPADLAPGRYSIEIGMYLPSTGARLPVESASERADRIVLTQVSVQ